MTTGEMALGEPTALSSKDKQQESFFSDF